MNANKKGTELSKRSLSVLVEVQFLIVHTRFPEMRSENSIFYFPVKIYTKDLLSDNISILQ